MLIGMWAEKAVYEFSNGNQDSVGNRLEAVHATLWQITYLHFVHVLKP